MNDKLRFGEIMVRAGLLARDELERVLAQVSSQDVDLGEVIVAKGLIDEAAMLQTLSKALNLPCVALDEVQPDPRALQLVPRELCVEHHLLPVEVERSKTGEHLHIAMANPSDVKAIKRITRHARLRIRPLIASARSIHAAIQRNYGGVVIPVLAAQASGSIELPPSPVHSAGLGVSPTPPPASSAGGGAMFDFGVTDLSAYSDEDEASGAFTIGGAASAPDFSAPELASAPTLGDPAPSAGGGLDLAAPPAVGPQIGDFPPGLGGAGIGHSANPPDQLGSDLFDALETSDNSSLMSTSDLGAVRPVPVAGGEAFGYVRRTRRPRSEDPVDQSTATREMPREAPLPGRTAGGPAAKKPLPPLPPGLRGRRDLAPPPEEPPTMPHRQVVPEAIMETMMAPITPAPGSASLPPPPSTEPPGMVDDPNRSSLRGMLDRYAVDGEDADVEDDTVIAEVAGRYGGAPLATSTPVPAGDPLGALTQAAQANPNEAARVLVTLVTHLARRGIVDPQELLNELRG